MNTEEGTPLGQQSATDRPITDDVDVCLRHNLNYARDMGLPLPFARIN